VPKRDTAYDGTGLRQGKSTDRATIAAVRDNWLATRLLALRNIRKCVQWLIVASTTTDV
jgi:hypothetical protein